jgi:BrxA
MNPTKTRMNDGGGMPHGSGEREDSRYRLSFTTGGLFVEEGAALAALYNDLGDWAAVRTVAMEEGFTRFIAQSSARRTIQELTVRLSELDDDELAMLQDGSNAERSALMWLSLCRAYPIIREFATEVLDERLRGFKPDLRYEHFDAFLAAKAQWNDALAELSDSTRKKLRQVLFRYMREAGILSEEGRILPYLMPATVRIHLIDTAPGDITFFPGASGGR